MTSDDLIKAVGMRIRAARKGKNMSQERLAELAELHPTYISHIELGKVNASLTSYNAIAQGLGLSLAELVDIRKQGESE